jgi:hypothetical protein
MRVAVCCPGGAWGPVSGALGAVLGGSKLFRGAVRLPRTAARSRVRAGI